MKKHFLIPTAVICIALSGCSGSNKTSTPSQLNSLSEADSSAQSNDSAPSITFQDYEWGTPIDKIKSDKITSEMTDQIDYYEQEVDGGYYGVGIRNKEVAGHLCDEDFMFSQDKLCAAAYYIPEMNESDYDDLLEKYSSKYGEPSLSKESTGWGRCVIWIDSNKNIVYLSEFEDSAVYLYDESPYMERASSTLLEYHEIDLQSEINKSGNTSGI